MNKGNLTDQSTPEHSYLRPSYLDLDMGALTDLDKVTETDLHKAMQTCSYVPK